MELERDGYVLTDDADRVDLDVIHRFLSEESYWATGIPRDVVERSVRGSLCLSVIAPGGAQAGFARVVTDRATFGWLADVFVLASHRGAGLGRWLCDAVVAHPDLRGLRRLTLATRDMHPLYASVGFTPLDRPEAWMERSVLAAELYRS